MLIDKAGIHGFALGLSVLVSISPVAYAADLTWDGSNGNWDDDNRWLNGLTEPTALDSAWINAGTVVVNRAGEEAGVVRLSQQGNLSIRSQAVFTTQTTVLGYLSGGLSQATVSDPATTWNNTGNIYVGTAHASGVLSTPNYGGLYIGDAALAGGDTGSLTISDSDADPTNGGHLWVQNSGTVVLSQHAYVGDDAGEFGTITINDSGSNMTVFGLLVIGSSGQGTLNLQAGGRMLNDKGYIGRGTGSIGAATVSGPGSYWESAQSLAVGDFGIATLTVEDGGEVVTVNGSIDTAARNGATSRVTVTGAGSAWRHTGALAVGEYGNAELKIEAGGLVRSFDATIATYGTSVSAVTITGAGSTWIGGSRVSVGGTKTAAGGQGTLSVLDDGLFLGGINIWDDGVVTLDGGEIDAWFIGNTRGGAFNFLDGTLTVDSFTGDLHQQGGTLAPGDSPGKTTINGDYNLSAGSIFIELAGTAPGSQHDQVIVNGTTHIDAGTTLELDLINSFVPNAYDSFTIIDSSTALTGTFGSISGVNIPGSGLALAVTYDARDVTVTAAATGDSNLDGSVNFTDFVTLSNNYNGPSTGQTWATGDFDGDGDVTFSDFVLLSNTYGYDGTAPGATVANSAVVPEPSSLALLGLGGLLVARRRR